MIFTIKEVDIIHKAFVQIRSPHFVDDLKAIEIGSAHIPVLIDTVMKHTGLSEEAIQALNNNDFLRFRVDERPERMDWIITVGFHMQSNYAEIRGPKGNAMVLQAPQGQYSPIEILSQEEPRWDAPHKKIQLKALHYDTEKKVWGFGIPCQSKSSK